MLRTSAELDKVFGPGSQGMDEEARAVSSDRAFVRSQVQLACDSGQATGRRMTAHEALRAFGWESLLKVSEEETVPLISKSDEPAATLQARRNALNLSIRDVANSAGVSIQSVERAETPGQLSPIRELERIAQALALDERTLGFVVGAGGDDKLGVRLREVAEAADARRFSAADVSGLAEAAWVVSRQASLAKLTEGSALSNVRALFNVDSNYRYPTYEQGYRLAETTRRLLEIGDDDPIASLKSLIEERLYIPVVQEGLADKFAGATVANGPDRGIVVNERGMNANVWVRRMTMAHELGHLLWDPDSRLNKLVVDRYSDLEADYSNRSDAVEIRANAFAISFLAPRNGIQRIVSAAPNVETAVAEVMTVYGISATAAKFHVKNISGWDAGHITARNMPQPSEDWIGRENLTIDWFPFPDTPISRRGRFAWFVARAYKSHFISSDTAGMYLKCSPSDFIKRIDQIFDALGS